MGPIIHPFAESLEKEYNLLKPWESSLPRDQFLLLNAPITRCVLLSGLAPLDRTTIRALPSLECVITTSAGLNHIDLEECKHKGIAIANAGTIYSEDVADYAVGLLIDVLRRVSAADGYVRSGLWPVQGAYPLGTKLNGKHVGIVGFGSIGYEVAKRLEAFGCTISYTSRQMKPVPFTFYPQLPDLAAWSDVLIVTCALTEETHHMINMDILLCLGKEGVIINVARGAIVNEEDLRQCLSQGSIGGAGLDVFENEPHVPHELLSMDNVVLSPHTAVLTEEAISDLFQLVKANLETFFANKNLISPVEI